jgi:hypothetical protein
MPVRMRLWLIRRREQRISKARLHDLLHAQRGYARW